MRWMFEFMELEWWKLGPTIVRGSESNHVDMDVPFLCIS